MGRSNLAWKGRRSEIYGRDPSIVDQFPRELIQIHIRRNLQMLLSPVHGGLIAK